MWLRRFLLASLLTIVTVPFVGSNASAGGGCFHGVAPTDGTGETVEMTGNCFQATVLHVEPGTTVTWVNRDAYAHTVTGVGGTWGDFSTLANGDSVSYRFDANGVYVYSCIIHPGMTGAVVVGDGSGDAGLAPAAVVALPSNSPAAPHPSATAATRSSISIWLAIVAGALAIAIAFVFVFVFATRIRSRRRVVETIA
jgi:plastocyanin